MRVRINRLIIACALLCVASLRVASAATPPDDENTTKPTAPRPTKPEKGEKPPKDEPIVWSDHVTAGPAVTIKLKRNVGKPLIYQGSLDRSQESTNTYHETDTFFLNVLCADRADGLDLIAVWRTYVDRKRVERLANGKEIKPALPNSNDLINLGPNYSIVGSLKCYRYDDFNRLAYRSEQRLTTKDGRKLYGTVLKEEGDNVTFLTATDKVEIPKAEIESTKIIPYPHVCLNETPHYFFPIFSARAVSPGDTWKFKVPVIIPVDQPAGGVLPTQFDINYVGRLRDVRTVGGSQLATVDYQVSGAFDSQDPECAERFAPEALQNNRIVHRVTGSGSCTVDLDKGRILEKNEVINVTLYGHALIPQGNENKPKEEENKASITSRYEYKLLAPGTKLLSGAVVPEYDEH